VIQSILFFTLGFLCAGFLALMVAPAIWRRAVALTRKRIEASVPLSLTDIQADKDRMRAEFAMSTRRLEMSIKAFKDKAAAQIIEINRNRDELKRLASNRDGQNQSLSEMEAKAGELRGELRQREDQLQRLTAKLAEAEKAIEGRALELDKMGNLYDEASLVASNRQIDLVVRETEVEKLAGQRKDAERRLQEITAENKTAREALNGERKKAADLEKKLDRMVATLTDREEKLDRRERELAQLREQLKGNSGADDELNQKLIDSQTDKIKLEAELADMTLQMSTLLSGAKGGDIEKAMARLSEDRERLEARLTALTRENKKLRTDLAAYERSKAEDWSDERRGNALLREQINDLAAEVVSLTATLEGPDSPINKALAVVPSGSPAAAGPHEKITSLADRVRALQKAASAG
jgi:chromosome segregation ATPase